MSVDAIRAHLARNNLDLASDEIKKLRESDTFTASLHQILLLEAKGENKEAYELAQSLGNLQKSKTDQFAVDVAQLITKYRMGQYSGIEEKLDYLEQYDRQSLSGEDGLYWKTKFLTYIGMYYHIKAGFEQAYDYYIRALELTVMQEDKAMMADAHLNLGEVQIDREIYDSAKMYFTKALETSIETNNNFLIAYSHYNLGKVNSITGELSIATDHLNKALIIFEEINWISGQFLSLNLLGSIDTRRGQYQLARNKYSKCLNLAGQMESPFYRAMIYHNLGILDFKENYLEVGINKLQKSIEIWSEIGNEIEIAHSIFDIVQTLVQHGKYEDITTYIQRLEQIAEHTTHDSVRERLVLSKALLHMSRNRLRDKVKAQTMLESLLEEGIDDMDLVFEVFLNLIDLKLFELKTFEDEQIMKEVNTLVENLSQLADEEGMKPLTIEILLLKCKLSLVTGNYGDVNGLLEEAKNQARNINSEVFGKKIEKLELTIYEEIERLKLLSGTEASLRAKIERSNLIEYLRDVSKVIHKHK